MTEVTNIRNHWRLIQWPLIWTLAAVAFVLGLTGFAKLSGEQALSATEVIYRTLQLFVLGANLSGVSNWQIEVARFLAPGVMAYTATQALVVLFREQLTLLRLRFMRGHVVVCGLGRTGIKVMMDSLRRGEKVVVIEEESENDWIGMSQQRGVTVLVGDATAEQVLGQARIEHARLLVIVCGNDGTNVETAIRAYQLKRMAPPGTGPVLECHVHIVEPDLRALFKEHRIFTDTGDRFRVVLFNIYESSARLLLRRQPLDREHIDADDPRAVHLMVIGFGLMGESLVLQAARTSHFANGRRLRVTVVDRDPSLHQQCLLRRHPTLAAVCDITYLAREADNPETLAEIKALAAVPGTLPTVAVCFDDDARALSLALALLPRIRPLGVPILLRMTTDGGLTTLLDADIAASRLAGLVKTFPIIDLLSENEMLQREMDAGAIAIHKNYVAQRRQEKCDAGDPSLLPWEELDEDLKDSCRQQADHIDVKLRAVGLTATAIGTGPSIASFTSEQIEVLARMEHARWNAERFLAGWSYAPGKKDIDNKTSPHLVSWEDLTEAIREYDRDAVRHIPHLVQVSRRRIVQSAGA